MEIPRICKILPNILLSFFNFQELKTPVNMPFPDDEGFGTLETTSSSRVEHQQQGYEGDTDDTLKLRKKQNRVSVREMAKVIQQKEDQCPSQRPFRPKMYGSESEWESEGEMSR